MLLPTRPRRGKEKSDMNLQCQNDQKFQMTLIYESASTKMNNKQCKFLRFQNKQNKNYLQLNASLVPIHFPFIHTRNQIIWRNVCVAFFSTSMEKVFYLVLRSWQSFEREEKKSIEGTCTNRQHNGLTGGMACYLASGQFCGSIRSIYRNTTSVHLTFKPIYWRKYFIITNEWMETGRQGTRIF